MKLMLSPLGKLGIPVLDELLSGPIADPMSILVLGDPGSGKSILCKQIVFACLRSGGRAIYVSFDEQPHEVRESMKRLSWDVQPYEEKGELVFLDCTSELGSDINRLNLQLVEAFNRISGSRHVSVVFDSLTTLMATLNEVRLGIDFLRVLNSKIKTCGFWCVYTLNRQGFDERTIALVKDTSDGVIEMMLQEHGRTLKSHVRILKMKAMDHSTRWVPYSVDSTLGVTFFVPKILMAGLPDSGKNSLVKNLSGIKVDNNTTRIEIGNQFVDIIVCETADDGFLREIRSKDISGLVLVVDSSAPELFSASLQLMQRVKAPEVPCMVVANKQDLPDAITTQNIKEEMRLPPDVPVIGTIATQGIGLQDAFRLFLRDIMQMPI